jgi:HK97 family phage portal protein
LGLISKIRDLFKVPYKTKIIRDNSSFFSFFNRDLATNETIFSAVSMLSNAIASAPVGVYQDGKKLKPSEHNLAELFKFGPNPRMTMFNFIKTLEVNRCTKGAGYAIKEYGYAGSIKYLWILNSELVTPVVERDTNDLYYEVRDTEGKKYIHNSHILQVSYMTNDGYTPINPLGVLRNTIDYDMEVKEFSLNQMKNSLKSNLVIKLQSKLSQEDLDTYNEMLQNMKKNGAIYVDAGKEFQELKNITYVDPNILSIEGITVERVERVYNMPGKLTKGSSSNKSSISDTEDLIYLKDTILPVIRLYEQELTKKLLDENELYLKDMEVKLSMNGFARATMEKRGNFYQQMLRCGAFCRNDIRELEDRPRITDGTGDTFYLSRDLWPADRYDEFIEANKNNKI